jgi:hypothetical protein
MLETHIVMSLLIFYLVLLLMIHLVSFMELTITRMVLVHERMLETRIVMSLLIFYLVLLLVLHLISFMKLTIAHMVLVHERIALCLNALVMIHIIIMVIVPRIGTIFLLEGLTPALSQDT